MPGRSRSATSVGRVVTSRRLAVWGNATVQMGIGLASSLLATGLVYFLTSLAIWASALLFASLAAVVVSFVLGQRLSPYSRSAQIRVGITAIASDAYSKVTSDEAAEVADNSLYFLGISAKRTISSPGFRSLLERVPRESIRLRFLLLDPDSPNLDRKAKDEGDSPEAWRRDISATLSRLRELQEKHSKLIEVRVYSEFPVWRLTIIDEKRAIVHFFPSQKQGPESPQLDLLKGEGSYFEPLFKEFCEIWEHRSRGVRDGQEN